MKHLPLFLLLLLLLGAVAAVAAPGLPFDHLTVGDGLTHNTVHTLLQDRQGFLWIGTRYGLNRYDGSRFVSYPPSRSSARGQAVFSLLEDDDGSIWVGYRDGGLEIIPPDGERGIPFRLGANGQLPVDWSTITVRHLFRDSRGWTWIATYGGGTVVLDEHRQLKHHLRTYNAPGPVEQLSNDFVFDFAETPAGDVYIATAGAQIDVWRHATQTVESLRPPVGYSLSSFAKSLQLTPDGTLWIGTSGSGLFQYRPGGEWRHFSRLQGLSHDIVTDLAFDDRGSLWIATDGGGLTVLDPLTGHIERHHYEAARASSLNTDALYHLLFDRLGNLWVGSFNGGLNVLRADPLPYVTERHYARERLAGLRSVLAVRQDSEGRVWLGTDGGGLFAFSAGAPSIRVESIGGAGPQVQDGSPSGGQSPDSAPAGRVVTRLEPVGTAGLWYGSYAGGLTYLDRATGRERKYVHDSRNPTSLAHDNVWDLALDPAGGLWVGLLGGGVDYLPAGGTSFVHFGAGADGLSDIQVKDLLLDRDGRHLWIATERGGLNRLDRTTGTIQRFRQSPDGLASDRLQSLFQDRQGHLWIGTEDRGLCRYDTHTGRFLTFGVANGYPFDRISGIVADTAGHLWISNRTHIYRWNPDSLSVVAIPPEPDLGYNLYNAGAATALADGRLVFGGVNGFSVVRPGTGTLRHPAPEVVYAGVSLDNEPIRPATGHQSGSLNLGTATLRLSYRDRGLRIQLANQALLPPGAIHYAYRLDGYRDQWTDLPAGSEEVHFSSLPGGTYRLSVRARMAGGTPGPPAPEIRIEVAPPFWERAWFAALIIALVGVGVYLVNAYFLRQQRSRYCREAMSRDAEILRLRNDNLQREVRHKQSELGASLLQVAHKNKVLGDMKDQIRELPTSTSDAEKSATRAVLRIIDRETRQEDYWEQFQLVFDAGYRDFVERLRAIHPDLTINEGRLCCFLRMELANQEIAAIQNVTLSAIEQAKYRMKKKLDLPRDVGLNEYIRNLG